MSLKSRYFLLVLLLFGILQVFDSMLTHGAVRTGPVQEANWLVERIVNAGGFPAFKFIGAFLCIAVLGLVYRRFPTLAFSAASMVVIFYGVIIIWNLHVLSAA